MSAGAYVWGIELGHGPAAAVHLIDLMSWEEVEEQFGLMLDL
jgi:hypothetical protein